MVYVVGSVAEYIYTQPYNCSELVNLNAVRDDSFPKLEDKWPKEFFENVDPKNHDKKLGLLMVQKQLLEDLKSKDESVQNKIDQLSTIIECLKNADEGMKKIEILKNVVPSRHSLTNELANVKQNVIKIREEHKDKLCVLTAKKNYLRDHLKSLNLPIDDIYYQLHKRIQRNDIDFVEKVSKLDEMREKLLASKFDDDDDELEKLLMPIDIEICKTKYEHSMVVMTLTYQKNILDNESKVMSGMIDEYIKEGNITINTSKSTTSTLSNMTKLTNEDSSYLKNNIGAPLCLGIAEILARRPADPIHYLAHWLFTYRYNKDTMEIQKRELDELLMERERIQDELKKRQVEIDAYDGVIDLINRAESEVLIQNVLPESQSDFGPDLPVDLVSDTGATESIRSANTDPDEKKKPL